MFGWDWDFEIMDEKIMHGEVIVKGKLTCRSNGKEIIKMQYGNKDIMYKKLQQGETERQPLSIGNDLKSAATDALKKCAAEIGIAADIYNTGIYLAGGGSMLRGLDKRLSQKTDLPVYIAEDPLRAVVRGTGICLKNLDKYKSVLANKY
jgi:actin-like ATPase involved in cell morphogenesis